ncbi:MAG TPA: hypothetical protein PLO33_01515, partial [Kouleothrix sp.]|nr:hypothetical protein [Kouleothrix sp.]
MLILALLLPPGKVVLGSPTLLGVIMADTDTTAQQRSLLKTYRDTVANERQRAARYGGEAAAPPDVKHNLADARAEIARLKAALRAAGVVVDDLPGDDDAGAHSQARAPELPLDYVPEVAPLPLPHHAGSPEQLKPS